MDLTGFYVLIPRVRTMDGLRLLYRDDAGIAQLKTLQWKPQLGAWVQGYNDSGRWDDAQAAEAFKTVYAAQAASKERHKQAEQTEKKEQKAKAKAKGKANSGGKCKAPAGSSTTRTKKRRQEQAGQKHKKVEGAKAKETSGGKSKAPVETTAKRKKKNSPPKPGDGDAYNDLAATLHLTWNWALVQRPMRKANVGDALVPLPGYSVTGLTHGDLSTLWPGLKLKSEAVNEMGRRLVAEADKLVFYNTFALERLHPVNLVEGTVGRGRPLSHTFFSTMAGVGALYDLDKQCENLSASGHTEVAIDTTKVFVQWTEHYINTKRIEYACRLVKRQSVRSR